jgi:hypothetical protein
VAISPVEWVPSFFLYAPHVSCDLAGIQEWPGAIIQCAMALPMHTRTLLYKHVERPRCGLVFTNELCSVAC